MNQENIPRQLHIELPEDVSFILNTLFAHKYEAYAVGGCVRDSLLGRVPNDWDITTNALPQEVKRLFRRTVDTGIAHGTVTIMIKDKGYEVTTYRVDGDYSDGRHPDSVEFAPELGEDLRRRDFTINAMAYNDRDGVVDLYDGIGDLSCGRIRCVGEPAERFGEDALRLLRAVRFSAQLGFSIEERTAEAISALADTIAKVSRERIHAELGKIFCSAHPEYLVEGNHRGLLRAIFPEYTATDRLSIVGAMLRFLAKDGRGKELSLSYAAFCHPLGAQATKKLLRGLKLDNATIDAATAIVNGLDRATPQTQLPAIRHRIAEYGVPFYASINYLAGLRALACGNPDEKKAWEEDARLYETVRRAGDPLTLKELAVTGEDLIAAGVEPGREMGRILQNLLDIVLDDPTKNQKDVLLSCV